MKRNLISCALTFLFLSAGCGQQEATRSGGDPKQPQVTMNEGDATMAPKPSVMLGVNMVPSGPIMQKHLGVNGNESTMIIAVADDTPASKAGLELWDVIVSVNGSSQASPAALRTTLRASKPGDVVDLGVLRGTQTTTIEVTLIEAEHERMIPLPVGTDGT